MIDSLIQNLREINISSFERNDHFEKHGIFLIIVPGDYALETWQFLRARVEQTEFWPVILGEAVKELESLEERFEEEDTVDSLNEVFEEARTLDVPTRVRATHQADEELDPEWYESIHESWPDGIEPDTEFQIYWNHSMYEPYPKVAIALVPTTKSWQVPAFLKFGGWNACPHDAEHVAFLTYWHEKYGVELVSLSHDTIEMQVARPPQDQATAIELAEEQFAYCHDIVSQGTGTIEGLAATLLNGTVWFFWWD